MTTPLPPDREFIDCQQAFAGTTRLNASWADHEVSAVIKKLR